MSPTITDLEDIHNTHSKPSDLRHFVFEKSHGLGA